MVWSRAIADKSQVPYRAPPLTYVRRYFSIIDPPSIFLTSGTVNTVLHVMGKCVTSGRQHTTRSTIFRQVQEHGMKFLLSEHYVGTLYLAAGSLPYMSTYRTDSRTFSPHSLPMSPISSSRFFFVSPDPSHSFWISPVLFFLFFFYSLGQSRRTLFTLNTVSNHTGRVLPSIIRGEAPPIIKEFEEFRTFSFYLDFDVRLDRCQRKFSFSEPIVSFFFFSFFFFSFKYTYLS